MTAQPQNNGRIAWYYVLIVALLLLLAIGTSWVVPSNQSLKTSLQAYEKMLTALVTDIPSTTAPPTPTATPTNTLTPTPTVVPELRAAVENAQEDHYVGKDICITVRTDPYDLPMEINWLLDGHESEQLRLSHDRYEMRWTPRKPGQREITLIGTSRVGILRMILPLTIKPWPSTPPPTSPPKKGKLCIIVFEDKNNNEKEDGNESRILNYEADILDQRDSKVGSKSKDDTPFPESGWCRELSEGLYSVHAMHPALVMPTRAVWVPAGGEEVVAIPAVTPTPRPTVTPTPEPTNTPSPTPRPAPILRFPPNNHLFDKEISRYEWDWPCVLRDGERFWLKVCKEGDLCLDVKTDQKTWQWWPERRSGVYTWSVGIVASDKPLVAMRSETRSFTYKEPPPLRRKQPTSFPTSTPPDW